METKKTKKKPKPATSKLPVTDNELRLLVEVLNTSLDDTLEWNQQQSETRTEVAYQQQMTALNRLLQKVTDLLEEKLDVAALRHVASVLSELADESSSDTAPTFRTAAEMVETTADLRGAC